MSNILAVPVRSSASDLLPGAAGVARTPFYLDSQGQALFAWVHRRDSAPSFDHGILLCPPLGHEQVHAHRGLRHLADALAGAGFPVVRFDYHGTGDSGGSDEDAERVATWLANIRDAHDWMTQQFDCRRITLLGLRLGATLAAQVATRQAVHGLLLWAPVIKGRSYVREMKALSLTAAGPVPPVAETSGDIQAAGFVLTEHTAKDLSRLNLLQSHPQCQRALIVTRDDTPGDLHLLDHLKQLGIEARQIAQPGYAAMMAEPHYSKVPREAIAHMVDWLLSGTSAEARTIAVGRTRSMPLATMATHSPSGPRERVLQVSQQPHLFGIVSEPVEPSPADLPLVVMLNAGSAYRVGPNRLYVALARQLAARGFRSFRLDLCGLGDSVCPDAARENDPYPATAFRDIALTLAHLRTHLGAQRVVLMGLCSGAYAAFQSAAQLASPVLVESVLINPLTFYWRDGMSLEASPARQLKSFQECMTSAWQPRKWLKLLGGRSKIGIAGALRMLVQRWRLRNLSGRLVPVSQRAATPDGFPTHPLEEDLAGDLERAVKAGRHLACFFARSDPGYGILTLYADRTAKRLRRADRLSVYFLDDTDHTFSRRASRRALGQALTEHLVRRYQSGA